MAPRPEWVSSPDTLLRRIPLDEGGGRVGLWTGARDDFKVDAGSSKLTETRDFGGDSRTALPPPPPPPPPPESWCAWHRWPTPPLPPPSWECLAQFGVKQAAFVCLLGQHFAAPVTPPDADADEHLRSSNPSEPTTSMGGTFKLTFNWVRYSKDFPIFGTADDATAAAAAAADSAKSSVTHSIEFLDAASFTTRSPTILSRAPVTDCLWAPWVTLERAWVALVDLLTWLSPFDKILTWMRQPPTVIWRGILTRVLTLSLTKRSPVSMAL